MSLNGSLGLGVVLEAKDMASGVLDHFGASVARAEGITKQAAQGIKQGLGVFGAGVAAMGLGLGGLMALEPALAEASAFGKEIALVATEVDAATFSQAAMKRETRDLASTFGRMPVEEAQALYKAVALGAGDATKSTALMTAVNQLAVAGNSDLKVTMDAVGGSLNAYHLKAEDAGRVSDVFFTAMKNGNTTVGDLAASVGRVGAGANEMGIRIEETLGAISVMTNKGIQASEAVAYLHGALANIAHPAHEARAEAARLGIEFNVAAVRSKGFVGFLHSIADNSKFTKDTLNKLFHGVEGAQAMAMLAADIGSVDAVMVEMGKSSGATAEGFRIMTETADFQEKRFAALKATALGLIGEALEPMKVSALKFASNVLDSFNKLSPATQGFIVKGLTLAATLLTVVGGVVALKGAIGVLAAGLSVGGSGIAGAFLPVVVAIGLAAAAFYLFKEAYDRNLGGFGELVNRVVADVKLAWAALVQVFTQGGFSGEVLAELNNGNQGVKDFAIQTFVWFHRIKNFVTNFGDSFSAGLNKLEPTFAKFSGALGRLGAAFGMVSVDTDKNGKAFDEFGSAGRTAGELLTKVVDVAVELATAFVDIITWMKPIGDAFVSLATDAEPANTNVAILKGVLEAMAAVKLASMASSAVQAIRAIAAAAGAANLTMGALGLAIAGVVAALYQAKKLWDEWQEGSGTQMWNKFKADIGYDHEEASLRNQGTHSVDDTEYWSEQIKAENADKRARAASAARDMYSPSAMAAAADAEGRAAAAGNPGEILASVASMVSQQPPIQLDSSVSATIDGDVLMSFIDRKNLERGVRNGSPMSSE